MDRTWEPLDHLSHCPNLIQDFHSTHPDRPRSTTPYPQQSARPARGARPKRGATVRNL
jgi:hypothetical protein